MAINEKILTVSIAAYNAGATLGRTLASVDMQPEYMDLLDVIAVDDGSTDNTAEIAEAFRDAHSGSVKVIHKANGGYGSTVNAAIEAAEGRYFKLLDGDDTFDADGLIHLLDYLRESSTDLVISPYITERVLSSDGDADSELTDRHTGLQTEPVSMEEADFTDGLAMFEICVRTDILKKSEYRLTEHCFYTDNEYVMIAMLGAEDVVRYPLPVYRYRLGVPGQSMGIEGRRKHFDDKFRAAYSVFDMYRGKAAAGPMTGGRKVLADKLISTMAREVYVSGMIMPDPQDARHVLKEFDEKVRSSMPDVYEITEQSRLVSAARKAAGPAYSILCRKVLSDEMQRTGSYADKQQAAEASGSGMKRFGSTYTGRILRIAEYIVAACMIIQCRTIWMHLMDYGKTVNRMTWLVMMAALAVCIVCTVSDSGHTLAFIPGKDSRRDAAALSGNDGAGIRRIAIVCLCMIVYTAVFLCVNPVNYLRVIRCSSAVMMMSILVMYRGGRQKAADILICFRNLMVIIAGVSLFCWIFGSTLHILPGTDFVYIDWSHSGNYVSRPTFINIYYETQWTGWDIVPAKNTGIFVEAPMAGFCLSLALMIELLVCSVERETDERAYRRHIARIVLLAVTIITSFSAVSYALLAMMAIAELLIRLFSGRITGKGRVLIIPVIILMGGAIAALLSIKLKWGSGSIRMNDFVVGFNAWLAHPFFGGGFESLEYLQSFMPEWRSYDVGFSNSPMEILAQGGIYLGIPYIYGFIAPLIRKLRERNVRACEFIIMFAYLFTFTVVPYQYITFFIIILLITDCLPVYRRLSDQ